MPLVAGRISDNQLLCKPLCIMLSFTVSVFWKFVLCFLNDPSFSSENSRGLLIYSLCNVSRCLFNLFGFIISKQVTYCGFSSPLILTGKLDYIFAFQTSILTNQSKYKVLPRSIFVQLQSEIYPYLQRRKYSALEH